ncbi:hypothetical protein [Stenotrophomonas humi]
MQKNVEEYALFFHCDKRGMRLHTSSQDVSPPHRRTECTAYNTLKIFHRLVIHCGVQRSFCAEFFTLPTGLDMT